MNLTGFRLIASIVFVLMCSSVSNAYGILTSEEALAGVDHRCPQHILGNQVLIDVVHWGFDGKLHKGQLVIDSRLAGDIRLVFTQMLLLGFPLESVVPVSQLEWSDSISMLLNNTSGFNYREVAGTGRLSSHAYGMAVDFNPLMNPYHNNGRVSPEGSSYDPSAAGTLHHGHPVVELLKALGWRWGGDWTDPDYQHFDKRLEDIELIVAETHLPCFLWRLL